MTIPEMHVTEENTLQKKIFDMHLSIVHKEGVKIKVEAKSLENFPIQGTETVQWGVGVLG